MDIAEKSGYTKIMMADCGTRLAVRVLSNLSEGRGAHVAMEAVTWHRTFLMVLSLKSPIFFDQIFLRSVLE